MPSCSRRTVTVSLLCALIAGVVWLPGLAAARTTATAAPGDGALLRAAPGDTALLRAAQDDACPNRTLPPPPVDESEEPPPGEQSPVPPPVPETPSGGTRMAECGPVLPPGAPNPPDDVTAASWLLHDLDTGEVLAAHDPHGRHRPASLVKTLLALVVLDELPPERIVVPTETDANQECTCVGIVAGGEYRVHDLVRALLMRSGNDVAHALATALGGVDVAVRKMNDLAADLGARDTHVATPSGLDGPGMMTSAYDMSLVFGHAMGVPAYAEAVATKEMTFPGAPGEPDFPVYNDNRLWGSYPGFLGGKTGFTDDSRHTYAGAAERDGTRVAVVLLRAEQRPVPVAEQARRLLDYGFTLAAGAAPVGTVTTADARSSPGPSPTDGAALDGDTAVAAAESGADDPFGTTGWIVTLVVTLMVIIGLLVGHRKGVLRPPE